MIRVVFRSVRWLVLFGIVVAVLLTFVFPTRTFLAQRASITDAKTQLRILDQQNEALADRADRLRSDEEIERLAREQYNLVRPGEEAYAVLPAPGAREAPMAPPVPTEQPRKKKGLLVRAWHAVASWF